MDAKTLTNICGGLLEAGIIRTLGEIPKGRGRPQQELAIDPDAAFALGLDIGARQVSFVVTDIAGNIRYERRLETESEWTKQRITASVEEILTAGLAGLTPIQRERVKGIGCAVPGILDRSKGVVLNSVNIKALSDFPVCSVLSDTYGIPAVLEESSRAMALAEIWFGAERFDDFICIDAGFGIGMGIVHEGRLYRGSAELSGEIGHTVVDPKGGLCTCGKRGCLETVASGKALSHIASEMALPHGVRGKDARALSEAAEKDCQEAVKVLGQAGRRIGVAIANAVNLFDPGIVILNGGLIQAGEVLVKPIREAVSSHCLGYGGRIPRVYVSKLGILAGAKGVSMLPLLNFFEFENIRF